VQEQAALPEIAIEMDAQPAAQARILLEPAGVMVGLSGKLTG
jgi:hypothetical protein